MISFGLEEDQLLVQQTVRKFAADVVRPGLRKWERAGDVPAPVRHAFHQLALGLVEVPEALGGAGAGLLTAIVAHEELAFGDPGAAVALWAPHFVPAALVELGDDQQARRLLARFSGDGAAARLGAVAWSERTGAPIEGFATVAEPVAGGYRLRGEKSFVINGGRADATVVFAQVDPGRGWDGIGAFVVEREGGAEQSGVAGGPRLELLGLETVHVGGLILDGAIVSDANRLAGRGNFSEALRRFFARVSVVTAARQIGLARAACEFALEYTQDRKAFGKPVAHFQANAFTLADMHMDVESARWLLWRAAAFVDGGTYDARLVADAAVHANEAAFRVADNAVQLLGGAGFIQDFPVEKWLRDTKTLALAAPTVELEQLLGASVALGHTVGERFAGSALQPILT